MWPTRGASTSFSAFFCFVTIRGARYTDGYSETFEYGNLLLPEASTYLRPHTLRALVRADITEEEATSYLEKKENAKCGQFFTEEDDGLAHRWSRRNWMNPPYGRTIGFWVKKAAEEATNANVTVARTSGPHRYAVVPRFHS